MPPDLRSLAEYLETAGREARARGEMDSALAFFDAALMARRMLDPEGARELRRELIRGEHSPKLGAMDADHREAISRGKTTHPMMKAARRKGFRTQAELAAAIGLKPNFLSAIVAGDKKMPPDKAAKLEALTGYRWES